MVAIMNGMNLHKGVKVASGGFLVFSDYFKAALRMACLMKLPLVLPLSHDSIAVGEDGPTHQPVEQLAMMRSMINMQVIRPADAYEIEICAETAGGQDHGLGVDGDGLTGSTGGLDANSLSLIHI